MRDRITVYVLLCIATILRFDFLVASDFRIDSDEAIVGLMARHALEQGVLPVFYYGQHYMGSFEPLMAALSFSWLGAGVFALKVVPLLFSILFLFLVYRLGTEIASPAVGKVALLLGAIPPATLVIWSTKARGGFIELLCIGTAAFLATVHWCKKPDERRVYTAFAGLLLGFGWWVNNQIIYYMLPVGFVMLGVSLRDPITPIRTTIHTLSVGLLSFVVGGAPFWIHNVHHNFVSFEMFRGAGGSSIFEHAEGFFATAVPVLLGGIRYWHTDELFPGSAIFVWLLIALVLIVWFRARSQQAIDLFFLKVHEKQPFELIILLLFAATCVFVGSSFGYLSQAPRYLLPAYTGLLILFAHGIVYCWNRGRVLSVALLLSWFLLSGLSGYAGGRAIPGEPFVFKQQRVQADHTELIDWLEGNGFAWVRTNYWIGYRLAFETDERVRFLVFGEPHQTRIPEYETAGEVFGRAQMPLVLVPAQAEYVQTALDAQGYVYKQTVRSGYVVLYDIQPLALNLQPVELVTAVASDRPEFGPLALDGSLETRWRSARPQSDDMHFSLQLPEPTRLRGLVYAMGDWPHDYPRELQIEVEKESGERVSLYEPAAYLAVRYYLQGDTTLSFYMDVEQAVAVHLHQTASHELFDWSIAEVTLYK